jgi:hypothetical protein
MRYEQRRRIKRLYWFAAASNAAAFAMATIGYEVSAKMMV